MPTNSVAVRTAFENLQSAQRQLVIPRRNAEELLCVRLPRLWSEFLDARVAAGEIDVAAATARLEAAQAGLSDQHRRTRSMTPEKRAHHFTRALIHQLPHADLADLAFSEFATGHNADEVCFNTVICLWEDIDRDVAAGKLDPITAEIQKADVEHRMDEIRRQGRVMTAAQRRRQFRGITLADFLRSVRRQQSLLGFTARRLAKVSSLTPARTPQGSSCRARRVVGGATHHVDGGGDNDGDCGDPPAWLSGACRWAAERVSDLRAAVPADIERAHRRRKDQAIAEYRAYCATAGLEWSR